MDKQRPQIAVLGSFRPPVLKVSVSRPRRACIASALAESIGSPDGGGRPAPNPALRESAIRAIRGFPTQVSPAIALCCRHRRAHAQCIAGFQGCAEGLADSLWACKQYACSQTVLLHHRCPAARAAVGAPSCCTGRRGSATYMNFRKGAGEKTQAHLRTCSMPQR